MISHSRLAVVVITCFCVSVAVIHPVAQRALTRAEIDQIHGALFRGSAGRIPAMLASQTGDIELEVFRPAGYEVVTARDVDGQLTGIVCGSKVTVVGTILGGTSRMTPDQGALFTEWNVRSEEVMKQNSHAPESPGRSILLVQEGGRINIQGRNVHQAPILSREYEVGHRYVFPLETQIEQTKAYRVMGVAFDVSGGHARSMDLYNRYPLLDALASDAFLSRARNVVSRWACK